jgi:hypothetical protein
MNLNSNREIKNFGNSPPPDWLGRKFDVEHVEYNVENRLAKWEVQMLESNEMSDEEFDKLYFDYGDSPEDIDASEINLGRIKYDHRNGF